MKVRVHNALLVGGLLVVAACGSQGSDRALDALAALPTAPTPSTEASSSSTTTATTVPARYQECIDRDLARSSLRPDPLPSPGQMPLGSKMAEILAAGKLRVGVDETTLGFAARDTLSGDPEGFEVELAKEIAHHIFGDEDDERVVFVPIPTTRKTEPGTVGMVDIVIDAVTMDCKRRQQLDFSAAYYTARQRLLVPIDSKIRSLDDLKEMKVCVTGSSSKPILVAAGLDGESNVVPESERTDCLVALQQRTVDAYFSHESFLYGMIVSDPTLTFGPDIVPGDPSYYGMAIQQGHPEFVRFVNAVLEQIVADGKWLELYLDNVRPVIKDALPEAEWPAVPSAPEPEYLD